MKNQLVAIASKINRQNVQFVLALVALVLFVLGAGAPTDSIAGGR